MNNELHLGTMTTREVAAWFNISYDTFKQCAQKHYEELKEYCDFTKSRGYITITKRKSSSSDIDAPYLFTESAD